MRYSGEGRRAGGGVGGRTSTLQRQQPPSCLPPVQPLTPPLLPWVPRRLLSTLVHTSPTSSSELRVCHQQRLPVLCPPLITIIILPAVVGSALLHSRHCPRHVLSHVNFPAEGGYLQPYVSVHILVNGRWNPEQALHVSSGTRVRRGQEPARD